MDVLRFLGVALDLAAKAVYGLPYQLGFTFIADTPHFFQEVFRYQHPARRSGQLTEQAVFGVGQLDLIASDEYALAREIDLYLSDLKDWRRLSAFSKLDSPQNGTDSGQ